MAWRKLFLCTPLGLLVLVAGVVLVVVWEGDVEDASHGAGSEETVESSRWPLSTEGGKGDAPIPPGGRGRQEDEKSVQPNGLLIRLRSEGLVAFAHFLERSNTQLPAMHGEDYYKRHPRAEVEGGELGKEILVRLKEMSQQTANADPATLLEHATALAILAGKLDSTRGYRSFVLSTLFHGVGARVLMRLYALEDVDAGRVDLLLKQLSFSPGWKVMVAMLSGEMRGLELSGETLSQLSDFEAYEALYDYYSPRETKQGLGFFTLFENNFRGEHNYDEMDVRGLLCLALMARTHCDIAVAFSEIRGACAGLPVGRDEFSRLAGAHVTALRTGRTCLLTGAPYEAKLFWKLRDEIHRDGASPNYFFEPK